MKKCLAVGFAVRSVGFLNEIAPRLEAFETVLPARTDLTTSVNKSGGVQ
ncbi:MAG TPA: hypothetical protein VMS31_13155 [Pyrinomonadaceae bacterium]|nr:hypothetical protein [Pyrinomonadaceae bacterium]